MNERHATIARDLLASLKRSDAPAPDVRARLWHAVESRVAAGEVGPTLGDAATTGARATFGKATMMVVVGAAVTAGALGWALRGDRGPAPQPAAWFAVEARDVESRPSPAVIIPTAEVVERPSADETGDLVLHKPTAEEPVSRRRRSRRRTKAATKASAGPAPEPAFTSAGQLAAEMAVMSEARHALRAGDNHGALAHLEKHAREFQNGVLSHERERSRVTALCRLGDVSGARVVALAYVSRHARSATARRMHESCAGPLLVGK